MTMDRLGSLNVFVQAAEARSFTIAARQLGISSSAVGKAVARLEERIGVRLFHRSTRSVTLTPEGTLFLSRCERIFSEIEAAEQELAQANAAPRGKLKVSLPMIGSLLMPAIEKFVARFPEIELDMDFTDRMVDVIEEGFDVVLRTGAAIDSRLMTRVVGTFAHAIVGSPDYLAVAGTPSKPEDLLSHRCLLHRWPATGKLERWPLSESGVALNLDLPSTAVASTLEPLVAMVEAGLGLACVPLFMVQTQIDQGVLVSVLEDNFLNEGVIRILWPSSRHLSPKIKAFVDFIGRNLFPETAEDQRRSHG